MFLDKIIGSHQIRIGALVLLSLFAAAGCDRTEHAGNGKPTEHIRLATTTSTEASGLLSYVLPPFEKQENVKVDVIAVGTGKALRLGENGDVDVVLIHARQAEDEFVSTGFGVNRRDVMHNDFVIVGPAHDPAGIKGLSDVSRAMRRIAGTAFASRGDESGTHAKERELWAAAGIAPEGSWRLCTGQGMGETLIVADEKQAYCLTDRATYAALKRKLALVVLCEGDPRLVNNYGVIAVNPAKHSHVNYQGAMKLIAYLTSKDGQERIAGFSIAGEQAFFADAVPQANREAVAKGSDAGR